MNVSNTGNNNCVNSNKQELTVGLAGVLIVLFFFVAYVSNSMVKKTHIFSYKKTKQNKNTIKGFFSSPGLALAYSIETV